MRVGLVSPYDFASPGGVNDHVRQLARRLTETGHEARIFAPSSRADVGFDKARFYRIGTPIAIPANDSVARITLSFHLANQVAAIAADERFDVLHFHEPLMPALPMTMLRMSTTANVGTFHAYARSNVGYYYGRPLLKPYLGHLHRAIAVSEPARAFVNRYFPNFPMRVIPNGIDLDVYNPDVTPIRHLRDDNLNILFVGRLEKRKGLGDLLRAYRAIISRIPHARLIIVGDGPLRGRAESYIARHRLPNVVMAGDRGRKLRHRAPRGAGERPSCRRHRGPRIHVGPRIRKGQHHRATEELARAGRISRDPRARRRAAPPAVGLRPPQGTEVFVGRRCVRDRRCVSGSAQSARRATRGGVGGVTCSQRGLRPGCGGGPRR